MITKDPDNLREDEGLDEYSAGEKAVLASRFFLCLSQSHFSNTSS